MKIPPDKPAGQPEGQARLSFYRDVIDACFYSQKRRVEQYQLLKSYYIYGCGNDEDGTPYNKIDPIVDTLTAFIYSADSTRFSAHLGPEVPAQEWAKVVPISKAVNSEWTNSGADLTFGQAVEWATVYNSSFVKTIVNGSHLVPYVVDPHCMGVYREDINGLDRQEAIAQRYYTTRSQLEADLGSHPEKAAILSRISAKPLRTNEQMPEGLRRILINNMATAAAGPLSPGQTTTGVGTLLTKDTIDYIPAVSADVVEMTELWVRDDEQNGDFRTVTLAEDVVVYDRPNIFVPGEQPFTQVCPMPMHGYFWGASLTAKLIGLQGWRNVRVDEIQRILALQAKPPTALTGFSGMVEETDFALNRAGGVLNNNDPMGKVERFDMKVSADIWNDIHEIDEQFSEAAALPPLLMGRGEQGVRSGRQTSELSRLGSSRIKKRALAIEDSLETLATKWFKAMRRYDKETYLTVPMSVGEKPMKFIMNQAPDDTIVKVDAHSNSPLFIEDQKAQATEMLEVKAIDRESYIELQNPPQKDVLLKRLPLIEAKEAAVAKAMADHETQLANAKHGAPNGAAGTPH